MLRLVCILTILLTVLSYPLSSQTLLLQREWIVVRYHPDDSRMVEHIFQIVQSHYSLLRMNLGVEFTGTLDIYLAANGADFGRNTGWRLPPWVQAVAMPDENRVVLKSPRWSGSQIDLGRAAVHEFVHILIAREIGDIPRWLNEGLAVMLSGEIYFDDEAISAAALSGRLLSFGEIEEMMRFNGFKAALAYQQSLSAVQYLVSQFGWEAVRRITAEMRRGVNFEEAFENATGMQVWEFELEWEATRGRMHRLTLLKDLNQYIAYLFAPLALLAGLFLYLRRRRIRKRWEDEEEHFDLSDY